MIFTRDFVTRENHWQIASLVTQKSLFTVTHALFFISTQSEDLLVVSDLTTRDSEHSCWWSQLRLGPQKQTIESKQIIKHIKNVVNEVVAIMFVS